MVIRYDSFRDELPGTLAEDLGEVGTSREC
jgi:hypothetical protein